MLLQVFSVHDKQANAFMTPFFMPTAGMAIRAFCDTCADENTQFATHPADYVLHHVGAWDDEFGTFDEKNKGPIFTALDAVSSNKNKDTLVDFNELRREAN